MIGDQCGSFTAKRLYSTAQGRRFGVGGKDMGNTLARTLVTGALPSVQRLRVTAIAPWPVRPEVRAVPVSMHNRRLLHGPDPPPAPTRPSGPHPPGCDDPAN